VTIARMRRAVKIDPIEAHWYNRFSGWSRCCGRVVFKYTWHRTAWVITATLNHSSCLAYHRCHCVFRGAALNTLSCLYMA